MMVSIGFAYGVTMKGRNDNMNCPTCNEPMVKILSGLDSGLVCQNDSCGEELDWCNKCDKPETHCYCCFYSDDEGEEN